VDLDRVVHGTLIGEAMLNAATAALVADDQGQYIAVNDAACQLTQYGRPELTRLHVGGLSADKSPSTLYTNLARGKNLRGTKRVKRRDGSVVVCSYWAIPTRVAQIPYFVLLLWPNGSRSRAAAAA
jgi:PAS domain S-box-containing protein